MNRKSASPHGWKIQLECVYRRDREERLKQAYALVVCESIGIIQSCKKEEPSHEKNKHSPLRKGIQ